MPYTIEPIATPAPSTPSGPATRSEAKVVEHSAVQPQERYAQAAERVRQAAEATTTSAPPAGEDTVTQPTPDTRLTKERERIARQDQALKDREKAIEEKMASLAKLEALQKQLASKDYSGVEELVDYEAYTKYLIEKGKSGSPEQQALGKLAAEIEALKKQQADGTERQYEAALTFSRNTVKALVAEKAEFSTIKELQAEEAVVQHILETLEQDGEELSPEQAAKEVEAILVEQAEKYSKVSKLKPVESKSEPTTKPAITAVRTLTNTMQPTGEVKEAPRSYMNMTDSERYAEARRRILERQKAAQKA